MLDSVSPDLRKCCENGIELMFVAGCFTPERVPSSTCSYANSSLRKRDPLDPHKPLRQGYSQAPHLQNDSLDKLLKNHQERMTELAKWHEELKLMLCQSGSASETTP